MNVKKSWDWRKIYILHLTRIIVTSHHDILIDPTASYFIYYIKTHAPDTSK